MTSKTTQVIEIDFQGKDRAAAAELLNRYGAQAYHTEIQRVRLAALRLAEGSLSKLEEVIETACSDYVEVISAAEVPNQLKVPPKSMAPIRNRAVAIDKRQWSDWLKGHGLTE